MIRVKLVCLTVGTKKTGGQWYKATFKMKNEAGKPMVQDFFLAEKVGRECVEQNLVDDVMVDVALGFDDFFRPTVTEIKKAPASGKVVATQTTLPGV